MGENTNEILGLKFNDLAIEEAYKKADEELSNEIKNVKDSIPTIPTKISAFENDAGYLTEHQSLENYPTK